MSKIRSEIGESSFNGPGQRRFVVNDESQAPIQRGREIDPAVANTLRQQAQAQQEQIESRNIGDSRRRIDIITGLGRRTRDVPVETDDGTVVFTLRTLKTFEQNELAQVIESSEHLTDQQGRLMFAPTSLAKIKLESLAHSLFLIDGQSIDIVLGTANISYVEQVLARKDLIQEMDHVLINHLYNNYEQLTKETYDG
jgi:hypothetical protein